MTVFAGFLNLDLNDLRHLVQSKLASVGVKNSALEARMQVVDMLFRHRLSDLGTGELQQAAEKCKNTQHIYLFSL